MVLDMASKRAAGARSLKCVWRGSSKGLDAPRIVLGQQQQQQVRPCPVSYVLACLFYDGERKRH